MTLSFRGLKELQQSYRKAAGAMGRAEARAVARVSTSIIARQSRDMAARVNLRIGTIKGSIATRQKPTDSAPRVVHEVRSRGIPLREFIGTRQTRKGLSVQVLKGGGRAVLRAAFLVGKFGRNAFGRAARSGDRYGSPHVGRLPLRKLYGPTVLSQYVKPEIQEAGAATWNDRLPVELERESRFALEQAGLL